MQQFTQLQYQLTVSRCLAILHAHVVLPGALRVRMCTYIQTHVLQLEGRRKRGILDNGVPAEVSNTHPMYSSICIGVSHLVSCTLVRTPPCQNSINSSNVARLICYVQS
jgi:hypothetical protein